VFFDINNLPNNHVSLTPRSAGGIRWLNNEAVRIAESIQTEEKVAILHTGVQNKGVLNSGEMTKTGGKKTKI
jgi:hypothetical protein